MKLSSDWFEKVVRERGYYVVGFDLPCANPVGCVYTAIEDCDTGQSFLLPQPFVVVAQTTLEDYQDQFRALGRQPHDESDPRLYSSAFYRLMTD